ncbi:MAG: Holliday junction resolvase RuvX, partial [Thermoanaerobaculia bacterium]
MVAALRTLGIDFGEKRIGLAISDPAGRVAVPLVTLERRNDRSAVRQIAEIAKSEGVGRLVLGEPVGLDGRRGEAAERVERFGRKLAEVTGLPLTRVDEAL